MVKAYRDMKKQLQDYLANKNSKYQQFQCPRDLWNGTGSLEILPRSSTVKYSVSCDSLISSSRLEQSVIFADDKSSLPDGDPSQTSVIASIVNSELPTVRKKERDYMGMFEFSRNDISNILKVLVIGECLGMSSHLTRGHVLFYEIPSILHRAQAILSDELVTWLACLHNFHVHPAHRHDQR